MTLFHLIRHGAYPLVDHALGGRADHALNGAGHAQAARLADALAGRDKAALVSSPVQRARETAAPIAATLGLVVQLAPAWAEIDFGAWEGRSFASLHDDPAWRAWNEFRSTVATPGGETMLQVQARIVGAMQRLAASWPDREVAIVTHGDLIKAALCHVLGAPLDLLRRIDIAAGSISRVALWNGDARVLDVNRVP